MIIVTTILYWISQLLIGTGYLGSFILINESLMQSDQHLPEFVLYGLGITVALQLIRFVDDITLITNLQQKVHKVIKNFKHIIKAFEVVSNLVQKGGKAVDGFMLLAIAIHLFTFFASPEYRATSISSNLPGNLFGVFFFVISYFYYKKTNAKRLA